MGGSGESFGKVLARSGSLLNVLGGSQGFFLPFWLLLVSLCFFGCQFFTVFCLLLLSFCHLQSFAERCWALLGFAELFARLCWALLCFVELHTCFYLGHKSSWWLACLEKSGR